MDTSQSKIITSITLAPELLARLDRHADAEERSRSWVIAKAVDQFLNSAVSSSSAGRGLVSECPAEQNPDGQRAGHFHPPWLPVPPSGDSPSSLDGGLRAQHARRHLNAKQAQEAALAAARRDAIERIG